MTLVKRSVIAGENEVGCSEFKAILVNRSTVFNSLVHNIVLNRTRGNHIFKTLLF